MTTVAPKPAAVAPAAPSKKPVAKVQAGLLAGALTTIVIGIANWLGLEATPEIAAALTTLLSFAAGYLKAP
jgi:hypothetical protein